MRTLPILSHIVLATLCIGLLVCLPRTASAQNIVLNPGFETDEWYGDLKGIDFGPGWRHSVGGDVIVTRVGQFPHEPAPNSGLYAAGFMAPLSAEGYMWQTLSTTVGQSYTFDFWAASVFEPEILAAPFDIYWNGVRIDSISLPSSNVAPGYQHYSYTVTASSSSTQIRFDSHMAETTAVVIDDVSVVALTTPGPLSAPEPASGLLMLGTVLSTAFALRRLKTARNPGAE